MKGPRRYPLIFNPKARSQKGRRALRFLMDHATRFALHATRSAEEARELAAMFARHGEPVVIAAGGDGTLNAVVQGLAGSQTALGVLPAGTMNVFARELGIPFDNLARAFEVIEEGRIQEIDLFEANGTPFVQMAGVGFDAMVIEETTWESKKMLGPLAYLLAAVKVLGETPPRMMVTCDDGTQEEGVAVLAGNGSLYGGQFKLFHKADNRDSMLDVLVFKEAGYKLVTDSLRGIALGNLDQAGSTVTYLQAHSLRVTADREVPVQVDGELVGRCREVAFGNQDPGRLRVLAPEEPIGSRFVEAVKSMVSWTKWKPQDQKS
ncbi:diacylglycerol kinase family lipid kinase [Luteolibacter flavescens]|uniref:Diacylglycerol kinase family lipid kinase n=1 Tax=Luteolibacter flavescens TaxID=1859460 RepID=A0ABT3FQX5_9BACT|nr:diacylglycerol kinase family protein [Luteolibacter flavescens]MCW1885965.1 diacylglycerol kinase family lipid kinase [Luteolibacter flavescens]